MPKVGRRLLIVAVLAVAGALAVAGVVSAKSTVKLSASKSKLAFNVKTIRANKGSVTLVMSNPSGLPHAIGVKGHGLNRKGKTVNKGGTSRRHGHPQEGDLHLLLPGRRPRGRGHEGQAHRQLSRGHRVARRLRAPRRPDG
jgi:hypothetical protein